MRQFTIRLSEAVANLISNVSEESKKNPTDIIRDAVEKSFAGGFGFGVAELSLRPEAALAEIRRKIATQRRDGVREDLLREEVAFLMRAWHQAYCKNFGNASPFYVEILTHILKDVFTEANKQKIVVNIGYTSNKLGIDFSGEHFSIPDISTCERISLHLTEFMDEFRKSPNIGGAENIARICSYMSDLVGVFDANSILRVFSATRIQALMPVAVLGILQNPEIGEPLISDDLIELLPEPEKFNVGGLTLMLDPYHFCLSISGESHCNIISGRQLLSILSGLESGLNNNDDFATFSSGGVRIMCNKNNTSIQVGSYMLNFKRDEFNEFRDSALTAISKNQWKWILARVRNLIGDI